MWEESNVKVIKKKGSVLAKDEWVQIYTTKWTTRGEKCEEFIYYNGKEDKIKWELYVDGDLATREFIKVDELSKEGFTEDGIKKIQQEITQVKSKTQ